MKYIVFINSLSKRTEGLVKKYIKKENKNWSYIILKQVGSSNRDNVHYIDYHNPESILDFFRFYGQNIITITARSEEDLPLFQKLIPFIPK